ncbi:MAG TPA: ABC transporter permease, partial [Streptosporangiaceae bacterium]|nr:ABC transporter permease [Streptosporangiaceae bacterium]
FLMRTRIGNWIFAVGGHAPSARAVGVLIFGMVNQGIVYAGWNPDWFQFFVGLLLLGAILLNTYIRRRAEASI